ncbi:hypothetical protein GCM10010377_49250 [Streptomyces viridiviolaceus]|nr:hypothetical protein GCM10010377_49250 [Streptomyces viridiviolaceus]
MRCWEVGAGGPSVPLGPAERVGLTNMVQALRPGGWLLLEDADPRLQPLSCPDESGPRTAARQPVAIRIPYLDASPRRGPRVRANLAEAAA